MHLLGASQGQPNSVQLGPVGVARSLALVALNLALALALALLSVSRPLALFLTPLSLYFHLSRSCPLVLPPCPLTPSLTLSRSDLSRRAHFFAQI